MGRRVVIVLTLMAGMALCGCGGGNDADQNSAKGPTPGTEGRPDAPPRRLNVNPNAQMPEVGSRAKGD